MAMVAELEGARLDWWVAKADGRPSVASEPFEIWCTTVWVDRERFSSSWAEGGPLIEHAGLMSSYNGERWLYWNAKTPMMAGPTPLVAAMRAYVYSKFGEEVPDE